MRAIIGGIVAIVIVLGFIAYEVTKLVAHAGNTTTSTAAHDPRSNPSTADQLG